jgi:hypothetical protein
MLLNDIYYQALGIEAKVVRGPSWARPYHPTVDTIKQRSPRHTLGHALISLGRAIAAEPAQTGRVAIFGRQ